MIARSMAPLLVGMLLCSQPGGQIIGQWQGASTCVKADWNSGCHDEQVVYACERSPADSARVVLRASKMVDDKLVPMGDIELVFQDSTDTWVGDFTTPRYHLSWQFHVDGNDLTGRLVELPSNRVSRHVKASRG